MVAAGEIIARVIRRLDSSLDDQCLEHFKLEWTPTGSVLPSSQHSRDSARANLQQFFRNPNTFFRVPFSDNSGKNPQALEGGRPRRLKARLPPEELSRLSIRLPPNLTGAPAQ